MLQIGTQIAWHSAACRDGWEARYQAQLLVKELRGLGQNLSFPNHKMGIKVLSLTLLLPHVVNRAY